MQTPSLLPPTIIIEKLALSYQNQLIFSDLDVTFLKGKFNILLGASGVGKSSLLKMIAGLYPYQQGTIKADDHISLHNRISYMAQQDLLMPWATILQNVMIGSRLRGSKSNKDHALYLLNEVGLSKNAEYYPRQLSGGMRQRVALARTLYENRPVILMDEPFSALDSITRHNMQTYTATLLQGKTVILITHDPLEACRLGENIQIMAGSPAHLYPIPTINGSIPRHPDSTELQEAQANLFAMLLEKAKL